MELDLDSGWSGADHPPAVASQVSELPDRVTFQTLSCPTTPDPRAVLQLTKPSVTARYVVTLAHDLADKVGMPRRGCPRSAPSTWNFAKELHQAVAFLLEHNVSVAAVFS